MNFDVYNAAATVLAVASAAQGYIGLIPLDPVISSGIGAVVAAAIFAARLILKKKPV
jgi:hypothetical protein